MQIKKYQVMLRGENFIINDKDDGKVKLGFYTTRWVEVYNPEEAELKAVDLVKNDESLKNSS